MQSERSQRRKLHEHRFFPDYQSLMTFQLSRQNLCQCTAHGTHILCSHHPQPPHIMISPMFSLFFSASLFSLRTSSRPGDRKRPTFGIVFYLLFSCRKSCDLSRQSHLQARHRVRLQNFFLNPYPDHQLTKRTPRASMIIVFCRDNERHEK